MKILIHSNAPWVPTGYGIQTRLLMNELRTRGHEVAVSAFSGLSGADITWKGHLIMPSGQMAFGIDMLPYHIERWQPDALITLMDFYKLEPIADALRGAKIPVLAWLPVDCSPLSWRDRITLEKTGAQPVAMSMHGLRELGDSHTDSAGLIPGAAFAPHMVDTTEYQPMADRHEFRQQVGIDDQFVVGICAANKDGIRKAFPEQFAAFANHHQKHPDSVLLVHSTARSVSGLDLFQLAHDMDILDCVRFTDQYSQDAGLSDTEMMRRWYSALDVLSLCSYGEGFGIPLIEAQACGTPVITSNNSAMAELVGPGWLVPTDPIWNPVHQAWWGRPRIPDIVKAYGKAFNDDGRRHRAREFALDFDVDTVMDNCWTPILEGL